ncbi:MAG: hypothetical protein M1482_03685 [Chloroflexi bacterium]|nr:hypothetical protein [Chloroflexota bacterium]
MNRTGRSVRWYQRAGVWFGIATGPGTLTVGGAMASQLPLASLLLIVPLGTLLVVALTGAQAVVSRRRGEPSSERAAAVFGPNLGSGLLNIVVALGALGWMSFYVGLAGFGVANLFHVQGWVGALILAVGLFLLGAIGLDRWNALVWLTAISTLGVALFALASVGTHWAPDTVTTFGSNEILAGVGSVVAWGLLFAVRVGDFAWDLDEDADVVKAELAQFFPSLVFFAIGALVYRAAGDWNIADVLARSESAALGNIFLVLAVIAPVLSGLHSGSLAISGMFRINGRVGMAVLAALAFVLGALRFDRELLLFLDLFAALFAPALVVMLLTAVLKSFNRSWALIAWLAGSAAALVAKFQSSVSPYAVGAAVSIVVLGLAVGWARITAPPAEPEGQAE